MFLIMGQTKSDNLGDIEVNSIKIRDNGGGGFIQSFNADGKQTMYAVTGVGGGGMIKLSNTFGNVTSLLSTNANEDGVINLFDRYGDYGWGMSGKQ